MAYAASQTENKEPGNLKFCVSFNGIFKKREKERIKQEIQNKQSGEGYLVLKFLALICLNRHLRKNPGSGSTSRFVLIIYFLDFTVGFPGSEFPGESREDWREDERCKLYPLLSSSSNRNSLNST